MKREPVKAPVRPRRGRRRWIAAGTAAALALGAAIWFFTFSEHRVENPPRPEVPDAESSRPSPQRHVTRGELDTLEWEDINPLLEAVGTDMAEIERLIRISGDAPSPAATYMRALLLVLQQQPERALAAFDTLDHQGIPPAFLYAPHRLQRTLRPESPDPYLVRLREAIAQGKLPPLIRARVRATDGELEEALHSYLQTDPAGWAGYDLEAFRRIGTHEGLAADLRKLIAGALASGRVPPALAGPLREVARGESTPADVEAFKRQLRREVEAMTPAGQIAIESAKKLVNDRKLFLGRKYRELLAVHRESEPVSLSTETVLLLFLAAVELEDRVEMDRWGQELKRRHAEPEVRDWVNEMTGSTQ